MAHTRKSNLTSRQSFRLGLALMLAGVAAWTLFSDNRFLSRKVEAAGFVVTNTNNSGAGSLRQAILDSGNNGNSVVDTISFNIPGGGVKTIHLTSNLPPIATPTTIDGYTQPGASPNNLAVGNNAVLLIEIDASSASNPTVFQIPAPDCTIKGLVIRGANDVSAGFGILTLGANTKIEGNFIGTNATGTSALGNQVGVQVEAQATNCTIGGLEPARRNVISGNKQFGVLIRNGQNTNVRVQGNYIGTDASGTKDLGNIRGVFLRDCAGATIGGTTPAARNLISGNDLDGIQLSEDVINTTIQGNYIGTQADGVSALGNSRDGVRIEDSHDNTVGGVVDGAGNRIAFNQGSGVTVNPAVNLSKPIVDAPIANAILSNSIFMNAQFGISLDGFHANDPGDGDKGPNNKQNFPVLTSAVSSGNSTTVQASLNSNPNGTFRIQVFANDVCDSDGFGEGQTLAGSANLTTDAGGNGTVNIALISFVAPGKLLTATATSATNDTSAFSQCVQVVAPPQPAISIADLSRFEGNIGTTDFNFNVTLSAASGQSVTVDYVSMPGSATAGSDFLPAGGKLTFAAGETSKTVTVGVKGDTDDEPNEAFTLQLSNPVNATLAKAQATGTIMNDDSSAMPTVTLGSTDTAVTEKLGTVTLIVGRLGSTADAVSVDYVTVDKTATQKGDYEFASGRIHFGVGEFSKKITVLINEDSYVEGTESFWVTLSNPIGATLGSNIITVVEIFDDQVESPTSPLDDSQSFVHMHYHDFLNREPDAAGLQFWTDQIESCGADQKCREGKRLNVSAAFFLSIEFQETGYLRYLLEKESYGTMPKYAEFMRDIQEVSRDVIVNQAGWEQKLKDNQERFAEEWASRPAFKALYDGMSNTQYVNALYVNAGLPASPPEQQSLVNALDSSSQTRAIVLLDVARNATFRQKEQSAAFVMMEYFGYLRRDPQAAPDSDLSGYNFWLNKLNAFGGSYIDAEMVKAFISSVEYRQRFGQ